MGVGCGFGPHLVMSIVLVEGVYLIWPFAIVLVVGLDFMRSCTGVCCGFGPH